MYCGPGRVDFSPGGVPAVDEDRDRAMLKRAIEEHSNNVDIDALLSQVIFRDDVSSATGVSVDASSPFSYTKDVEVSGHTV